LIKNKKIKKRQFFFRFLGSQISPPHLLRLLWLALLCARPLAVGSNSCSVSGHRPRLKNHSCVWWTVSGWTIYRMCQGLWISYIQTPKLPTYLNTQFHVRALIFFYLCWWSLETKHLNICFSIYVEHNFGKGQFNCHLTELKKVPPNPF